MQKILFNFLAVVAFFALVMNIRTSSNDSGNNEDEGATKKDGDKEDGKSNGKSSSGNNGSSSGKGNGAGSILCATASLLTILCMCSAL